MIEVREISKSFGEVVALRNLSFNIPEGEVFGFLGPNGAGKSTTINILNTLLRPDNGQVFIDGHHVEKHKDHCKSIIGVVPQEIALYEKLSANENLLFWGSLYNIPKSELQAKAREALEIVGLSDRRNDLIKTYSGGMKRRINIASSILHNPKVLLMDEPTVGVDPQSRNHIFEVIERLNSEGMTIIYTTHYMEEAERLCNTIAVIDMGTIVAQGTLKELREVSDARDLLTINLSDLNDAIVADIKSKIPSCKINHSTNTLELEGPNISNDISMLVNSLQDAGGVIETIDTHRANLEAIFFEINRKTIKGLDSD